MKTTSPIEKYFRKGVLVDTNLLIVLLVGWFNPQHLKNCRATKSSINPEEFLMLERFVGQFDQIITTPHILTEVSNLAGRLPESLHTPFRMVFSRMIETWAEQTRPAAEITKHPHFLRFGLTDTAISMIAPGSCLVLTDELPLFGLLQSRGVDVINFNEVREQAWDNRATDD